MGCLSCYCRHPNPLTNRFFDSIFLQVLGPWFQTMTIGFKQRPRVSNDDHRFKHLPRFQMTPLVSKQLPWFQMTLLVSKQLPWFQLVQTRCFYWVHAGRGEVLVVSLSSSQTPYSRTPKRGVGYLNVHRCLQVSITRIMTPHFYPLNRRSNGVVHDFMNLNQIGHCGSSKGTFYPVRVVGGGGGLLCAFAVAQVFFCLLGVYGLGGKCFLFLSSSQPLANRFLSPYSCQFKDLGFKQ